MKPIILVLIALMYGLDLALTLLNYRYSKRPLPPSAQGIYDHETYNRWLNYSLETMRLGILSSGVITAILLGLMGFNVFGWVERLTASWFSHPILQTLAFLGIFVLLTTFLSLPFDYYRTFVIEEKFGFNKTTLRTFVLDHLKSLALATILGGAIVALLNWLYLNFQARLWLFILAAWLILSIVLVIVFVLSTKVFVKIFNKLTPLPEGPLKEKIAALAESVGFQVRAISVMDASKRSTKLNAFFSGLGRTREVVLFDTLLERLPEEEVLSVVAHELGHAVHKDTLRLLVTRILVLGLYAAVIGAILQSPALGEAFGLSGVHFGFSLVLFSILVEPLEILLSLPLNALSRRAEYAADAFAARKVGAEATGRALRILAQENLANLNPHPLYVLFHYSHPPIPARLEAIAQIRE
ncbi:MAG: M48 family metallopeptidase [Anaerolineales bacterium]|nr:M48 family metallopeptidase [Anaerolineales bacterium]MDW8226914.1 M48 family metallopeptidase [Anaerolineales bacterium]